MPLSNRARPRTRATSARGDAHASLLLFAGFGIVRTTVFVLELVDVLGLVDAFVLSVGNAVVVVVEIGATVGVLKAVGIFRLIGALITRVGHAVVVAVRFVGAAVLVFVAVLGLRLVRTLIGDVGDAVLVVVRVGTTIAIFEAVLIFGRVRTLVELKELLNGFAHQ